VKQENRNRGVEERPSHAETYGVNGPHAMALDIGPALHLFGPTPLRTQPPHPDFATSESQCFETKQKSPQTGISELRVLISGIDSPRFDSDTVYDFKVFYRLYSILKNGLQRMYKVGTPTCLGSG
jgi:hypothetical protein